MSEGKEGRKESAERRRRHGKRELGLGREERTLQVE